jgi:transcriptional regulator with XRE-family HTH domain
MELVLKRIEHLMKKHSLSASEFSERINVNKATLSHLLSGRNKPSLEIILKVCDAFEDIRPNDLLLDENSKDTIENSKIGMKSEKSNTEFDLVKNYTNSNISNSEIERIVIFFKDQTFKEYKSL